MKEIITSIFALILTIGILFITSDCEVYFAESNPQFTTTTTPADVEHTHASHHMVNDIISESFEDFIMPIDNESLNFGLPSPSIRHNYFSSIWQPPKFSWL